MSQVPTYKAGQAIKDARTLAGLSREQLGLLVFPMSKTMSQYTCFAQFETDKRGITLDIANRIDVATGGNIVKQIKNGHLEPFKRLTGGYTKNT